ncbi:MAG: hypothetical protein V4534_04870 [Myxococcota bacterium]
MKVREWLGNKDVYLDLGSALTFRATLMHVSKRVASQIPQVSILLRVVGDASGLFFIGWRAERVIQDLGKTFPGWVEPKGSRCDSELNQCREQMRSNNQTIATDGDVQAARINYFKQEFLVEAIEKAIQQIETILRQCSSVLWASCEHHQISNVLIHLTKKMLKAYPGMVDDSTNTFVVQPDITPLPTREHNVYDEELIAKLAYDAHLSERIPKEAIAILRADISKLCKGKEGKEADYILHFLKVLGITIYPDYCPLELN